MYTRSPQGRFPREMTIPKNYSGNTFRSVAEELPADSSPQRRPPYRSPALLSPHDGEAFAEDAASPPTEEAPISSEPAEQDGASAGEEVPALQDVGTRLRGMLSTFGTDGFGSEEALLLALILLLSGRGASERDPILPLLLLLLVR